MTFYPYNWRKVSVTIRRLSDGRCQRCGQETPCLSVHHIGAPLATGDGWRPGDPHDKRDLRLENLTAICEACHDEIEPARVIIRKIRERRKRRRVRHRALGIGVGLILYEGRVA